MAIDHQGLLLLGESEQTFGVVASQPWIPRAAKAFLQFAGAGDGVAGEEDGAGLGQTHKQ